MTPVTDDFSPHLSRTLPPATPAPTGFTMEAMWVRMGHLELTLGAQLAGVAAQLARLATELDSQGDKPGISERVRVLRTDVDEHGRRLTALEAGEATNKNKAIDRVWAFVMGIAGAVAAIAVAAVLLKMGVKP